MNCTPMVEIVSQLPASPTKGGTYSFARARREDVVGGTHGVHKYPAKFIPQIPAWALGYDPRTKAETVLDPFCGSGTTLVEAGLCGAHGIGLDISPLAALLTRAKCAVLSGDEGKSWLGQLEKVVATATKSRNAYQLEFEQMVGQACFGMHNTWSNWFNSESIAGLVALREAIKSEIRTGALFDIALASLSSVTKACSFLNEDQIKVRYQKDKKIADPFLAFSEQFKFFVARQLELGKKYTAAGARFDIYVGSAESTGLLDQSVDRVITSPPYINAIDYTMAHKYNLFVLGLLEPAEFKHHCRQYIGVTERAVRVSDLLSRPSTENHMATEYVEKVLGVGTSTSLNRTYVVAQYFHGMHQALREGFRVLSPGGLYFLVVGQSNRICGITVPTAEILEESAREVGFTTELSFLHALANRSSMRLNRSKTGGEIPYEHVYVFRK